MSEPFPPSHTNTHTHTHTHTHRQTLNKHTRDPTPTHWGPPQTQTEMGGLAERLAFDGKNRKQRVIAATAALGLFFFSSLYSCHGLIPPMSHRRRRTCTDSRAACGHVAMRDAMARTPQETFYLISELLNVSSASSNSDELCTLTDSPLLHLLMFLYCSRLKKVINNAISFSCKCILLLHFILRSSSKRSIC